MHVPSIHLSRTLPHWLDAVMLGDTHDEGSLWRSVTSKHSLKEVLQAFTRHMDDSQARVILEQYGIADGVEHNVLVQGLEEMARDVFFTMPNYMLAQPTKHPRKVYWYHMDQTSTLDNPMRNLAYHAIDAYYVFLNAMSEMTPEQSRLALKMADDFILFANGDEPYSDFATEKRCAVYGPNDSWSIKSEEEDEGERQYSRMANIIDGGLYEKFWSAMDDFVADRQRFVEYSETLSHTK
jgi:carboxylesterase type B